MIANLAPLTQSDSSLPSALAALESAISALESSISTLDNRVETLYKSLPRLEHFSWVFTALVALGVAMEAWVIFDEHREDMETWALTFFGINRTVRPSVKRLVVGYVSVVLVAGGIIGELAVGIRIASVNAQLQGLDIQLRSKNADLRSKSDQLVALVTQEAGSAKASAEVAASAASRANAEAEKSGAKADAVARTADELLIKYGNAERQVADLQSKGNEAAIKLEEEKQKRVKLAVSLLSRYFGDQSEAARKIANLRTSAMSVVFKYPDEREIKETAEQIAVVFDLLHWHFERVPGNADGIRDGVEVLPGTKNPPPTGRGRRADIEAWQANETRISEARAVCEALSGALNDSGIAARVGVGNKRLPTGKIEIRVGPRPDTVLKEALQELGERPRGRMAGNRIDIPYSSDPDLPKEVP